jgi:ABC-type branched-subunit amino acid transport system substrate-binding protein
MPKKLLVRLMAVLCVMAFIATACSSSKKSSTTSGTNAPAAADLAAGGLLWAKGACDPSLPKYNVGILTVWASPILSQKDQVDALEVSVDKFNQRGGIGKHCMEFMSCDTKADPAQEADCARQLVQKGVHITINDNTTFGTGAEEVLEAANVPRLFLNPGNGELAGGCKVCFPVAAGGLGITAMQLPPLTDAGFKKIYAITVAAADISRLFTFMKPIFDAHGAKFLGYSPVPAGTTDYQQFILKAQAAGADGIMLPLGGQESEQVLNACVQLNCKLAFSMALAAWSQSASAKFADNATMFWDSDVVPATASQTEFPILKAVLSDLESTGKSALQAANMKATSVKSWLGVADTVRVIEDSGNPNDVTREGIFKAFRAAKDLKNFGLIPPWTPSDQKTPKLFPAISQPWYSSFVWDKSTKNFKFVSKWLNFADELSGKVDYPQPVK